MMGILENNAGIMIHHESPFNLFRNHILTVISDYIKETFSSNRMNSETSATGYLRTYER